VDGYSHHEQKKQDLQVSKKKGWFMQEGQDKAKTKARGGLTGKASLLRVYICAFLSHIRYLQITLLVFRL
jgi:hypothetical protein